MHLNLPRCRSCCWVVQRTAFPGFAPIFSSQARSSVKGGATSAGRDRWAIAAVCRYRLRNPFCNQNLGTYGPQHRSAAEPACFRTNEKKVDAADLQHGQGDHLALRQPWRLLVDFSEMKESLSGRQQSLVKLIVTQNTMGWRVGSTFVRQVSRFGRIGK